MRGRAIALALLALLAAPRVARGDVKNLNGQPAPELGRFEQVAGTDRVESLAALKGRAVLIAFFDSTVPACEREAPRLDATWKQLRDRGFVLVAVSGEDPEKIKAFVAKTKTSYPVLAAPLALKSYGIDGYPTKYLVAPSGKVVASEHVVTTAAIEEQLEHAIAWPLREYSTKFTPCLSALEQRDLARAATELSKLEKEDGADGENARILVAWIEDVLAKKVAAADAARETGELIEARDLLAEVARRGPPLYASTKAAKEKLKALREDKEAKRVFQVDGPWRRAREAEQRGESAKAAALYIECAKATRGTRFAERCAEKARDLAPRK